MFKRDDIPTPPVWLALIPVLLTAILLVFSVFVVDAQPHFALLIGAATAGLCAAWHGFSWKTIKEGFKQSVARTIPSIMILLIIGMLIAVWISHQCRTQPTLLPLYLALTFTTTSGICCTPRFRPSESR